MQTEHILQANEWNLENKNLYYISTIQDVPKLEVIIFTAYYTNENNAESLHKVIFKNVS